MVPDYQLEDTARQAAMERREREPKERCFKCGAEIEPQELIEHYDLAFCGQGCLERAKQCPECGEPAEEVGGYCPECAEKNRIYTMSDAEFWGEVNDVLDGAFANGWEIKRRFYHWADALELVWFCLADKPIKELTKLFEARDIEWMSGNLNYHPYASISVYLTGGKYREA